LRAGRPRPYLDKKFFDVQVEGSGVVSTPGIFFSRMLKKQAVDLGRYFELTNTGIYSIMNNEVLKCR
jgi:hypothetical protein